MRRSTKSTPLRKALPLALIGDSGGDQPTAVPAGWSMRLPQARFATRRGLANAIRWSGSFDGSRRPRISATPPTAGEHPLGLVPAQVVKPGRRQRLRRRCRLRPPDPERERRTRPVDPRRLGLRGGRERDRIMPKHPAVPSGSVVITLLRDSPCSGKPIRARCS